MTITGRTAVAGVGVTAFGKLAGRSAWSLQAEAVRNALADAGLTKDDVDGLLTEPQFGEPLLLHGHVLGRMLGLKTNYLSTKSIGGATAISLVQEAAMAIDNGLCEVAVCVFGDNPKTGLPMLFGLAQMGRGQADEIAFEMAGVTTDDVDVMQFYDCFTSTVLITLEDYGFCKKGEGGPFAQDGGLKLGGELPSNTSGGMLSEGDLTGWGQVAEGARQIRGECGERQVPDAQVCVVAGHGGFQAAHA